MDWLKSLGGWVWAALGLLAGGAVFAKFAMPLFDWFWGFAEVNVLTLIALAIVAGIPLLAGQHSHKDGSYPVSILYVIYNSSHRSIYR